MKARAHGSQLTPHRCRDLFVTQLFDESEEQHFPLLRRQPRDPEHRGKRIGRQAVQLRQAGAVYDPDAGFTLRADALSAIMLVMITFIGTFIAIYSVGYMHGEGGYPRFFAEIALFVFSMTTLVLADTRIWLAEATRPLSRA